MTASNRKVVLTGASGGIGRAIAEKLAADGAQLILVARNVQKLERLLDTLGGHPHVAVAADIADRDGRRRLLEDCQTIYPDGINLLINNAGITEFGLFEEQSQQAIANLINVNLLSPILVCQDLLSLLMKQDEAHIINVGSTFGGIGYPGYSTYCASKFGLRGFTESLRRELAQSGPHVSYIAPRATRTALNSDDAIALNDALGTTMDTPSRVADEIVRIISAPLGRDQYLGWPEKLFVRINALLPGLVDNSLRKQLPIIRHFAKHGT